MKKIFSLLVGCVFLWGGSFVAAQQSQAELSPVPVPAYITQTTSSGVTQTLLFYIVDSSDNAIRVISQPTNTDTRDISLDEIQLFMPEPEEYSHGIQLFISEDFAAAAEQFEACYRLYYHSRKLRANYSELGAYYLAECYRKLQQWDSLNAVSEKLDVNLLPQGFASQAELYPMWLAYSKEEWERLLLIEEKCDYEKLHPALQAQVSFLTANAYEALGNLTLAKIGYSGSFVLNYHTEPDMTKLAADRLLNLYLADEELQESMQEDEEVGLTAMDPRRRKLQEAAVIAFLYEDVLSAGETLPEGSEVFLKYLNLQEPSPVLLEE